MKKILALTLVLMLTLTSVFTGVAVSAEDAAVEETPTVITETVWEEEYGIKVDESIFPGYYLGDSYKVWDNPDQTKWTPENGVAYYMTDNKGGLYTFRDPIVHRRYTPSIAIDAGRTGLEGDNALVFGLPKAYNNGYLMFRNRNVNGGIVCGSGTYDITFDVKLVSGKVDKIYANFILYAPGIATNANCVNDHSTALNTAGDTNGYSGSDISSEKWTNLSYTTTVTSATNSFFINFTAPEEGAIVLIDNLQIVNTTTDINMLNSENFYPISANSPYYSTYNADTFYVNEYFGNFNDPGFSAVTDWEKYNLTVDESIVPGYSLGNGPYYFSAEASETSTPATDGLPYLDINGGWYSAEKNSAYLATRRRWIPAVALGAGKTGKADDNALVFGMPKASAQTPLAFYIRDKDNKRVYSKNKKYKVSFDIKSVAGNCKGIYSTVILYKPITSKDSKYTCLPEDANGNITQTVYNNKYNAETGTYGTDGYSQADISTTEWTTLTFTTTTQNVCDWFYINIVPSDDSGAVVLIDNITIQANDGVNMFNADYVQFTGNNSAYKGVYEPIQYYLGTFDYADPVAVESVVDPDVTYVPHPEIYFSNATVAPTITSVGEGVNGSYAMALGVDPTSLANQVRIQGFNYKDIETWYPSRTYLLEFKLRLKSGTANSFKVSMSVDGPTINLETDELLYDYDVFLTDTGWYRSHTQTYMNIAGSDITNEWQKFRVYITTNGYVDVYRQLVFDLVGATADTVVLMDDLKAFDITNPAEEKAIWIMNNMDPAGTFMDLAQTTKYEIVNFNDTRNIIKVSDANTKVDALIANMNVAHNLKWGYVNYLWAFEKMPEAGEDGTIPQAIKETYLNGKTVIGTDYALVLLGRNGKYANKIYENFTIAVENDISGDGAVDARDIVRAKKISAGSLTATDAQLVAANATDGNGIQAEEVLALRGMFMN